MIRMLRGEATPQFLKIGAQDLILGISALSCAYRGVDADVGSCCPLRLSPPQSHIWFTVMPGEVPGEVLSIAMSG